MRVITQLDTNLKSWATEQQCAYIDAINKHKGIAGAAAELGMETAKLDESIRRLLSLCTLRGYAPDANLSHPLPDPLLLTGVSQYYDADGKPGGQWLKSSVSPEAYRAALKGAISAFMQEIPQVKVPPAPRDFQSDIIPWIQIGDAHIGMLAHAAEVGENFDLKIAEHELCGAIGLLIDEMPACERIVINDLGDATHADNMSATTAASHHPLDVDGRHPKMLRVYSRVMRFIVDKALTKAAHVDVIINQGNHSRINDFWMRELLTIAYAHTGRVHVLDNDSVFIGYRMGNTFVMVHHSDKCPPQRLVGVMTSDFRKDFGETEFHYIDIGHVHHHFVSKEYPSVIIESWNHLAAGDKWAHESGYRARKAISVVLRSKTYGDVGRRVLSIEEVRARLNKAQGKTQVKAKSRAYAV